MKSPQISFEESERARPFTSIENSMKLLFPTLLLLASCATPAAMPAPEPTQNADAQTSPDTVRPDLVDLPEDDQISQEVDEEDTNDDYCAEFMEQQEDDSLAECIVLEADEDIAIIMKTSDATKPVSTFWAIYCGGLEMKPVNIPPGLPEALHSLTFERNKDILVKWTQGSPAISGTMTLPLPECAK